MITLKSIRKSESGQIVVLTAILISLFLIGFAALVIDVGFLYSTRRNMQTVADAAAIAGANALNSGLTCNSSGCAAAQDVATLNGYTNGVSGVTVAVSTPAAKPSPSTGTYVEVDVSQPVPTYFLRALSVNTVNVGAKAVAGFAPPLTCMIALDPNNASKTFTASGSANIKANCGIDVDSTSSDGLDVSGAAKIDVTPSTVGVVGSGYSGGNAVTPPPQTGVSPVKDPYSFLVPPAPCSSSGGCGAATCNALTSTKQGFNPKSSQTIDPGVYCGGISISGSITVKLNPGTYILVGGNGDMVSGSAGMTGSGVTFYNTYSGANPGNYRGITFSGNSATNLSAPPVGATVGIPGILFYQDPSIVATGNSSNGSSITGSSGTVLQGGMYFPTTMLTFSGGTSVTPENLTLVAYMLTFSGGTNITSGGTSGNGTSITTSKLYE
jgi:Flp pilus assembly protein TadG